MDLPPFNSQDELAGAVRRVVVERAKLQNADRKLVEMQRRLVSETDYDSQGRQLEEVIYDPQGVLLKRSLRNYDPTGDLKEIMTYAPDGSLVCRQVYDHDRSNRTIKELAYKGHQIAETIYSLDETGKVISQTTVDSDAQMSTRLLFQYDAQSRVCEISICVSDSKQLAIVPGGPDGTSVMLSDDMRHKLKGVVPCSNGLLTSRTVFGRDRLGHLVETAMYSGEGVLIDRTSYSREFDSHGNWIKETQSKWSSESNAFQPVESTYRKIVYR
jgi:antitoxin component YwqK of YwqJK toxin-antitoxin module